MNINLVAPGMARAAQLRSGRTSAGPSTDLLCCVQFSLERYATWLDSAAIADAGQTFEGLHTDETSRLARPGTAAGHPCDEPRKPASLPADVFAVIQGKSVAYVLSADHAAPATFCTSFTHRGRTEMLHICKSHGWAAVAVIGACMTMGGAQAAVITETAPVAGHQFVDPGQDVLVPNFDPALGTLTGASASLTGQFTPGVSFTTNSSTFPDFAVTFNPSVSFSGSVQFLALQGAGAQSTGDGNGQSIGTPGAVNITRSLSLGNLPTNPVFPGDLDFYIIGTSLTRLPPGAFFTQDLGVLTAQLAVTYTYTPGTAVPEPASLALLGAGLLGFCTVRSGMRRSASF